MELDTDFVRSFFPALAGDWVYMDNAGGSLAPRPVIDRARAYMARGPVQLGASYELSARAAEDVAAGQAAAALFMGAAPGEAVVGPSTTMNAYVLAQALRPLLAPGDEVVVTNLDHEANNGAWRRLAEYGVVVREWAFDPTTLMLRPADLAPLLGPRTRLVCFTHCANVVGAFQDVAAITELAHGAGAWVCVDGVAYAPHRLVDVGAWDVDFYLVSLYKAFGPHLAAVYGKAELLRRARGQSHFFVGEDEVPYKLQPGGVNHELTAALPGMLDYFGAVHDHHFPGAGGDARTQLAQVYRLFAAHETTLVAPLLAFLGAHPRVRVLGPPTADPAVRAPTVSFVVAGRKSSEIPPLLDERRIAVRWGHFYAYRAVDALGLLPQDGVVRVSLAHYNTVDEVERLVEALDAVL
jgi:cysteine desulfurase family protein (TIGR01976 family)